jgi:hypothetical protein
MDIIVIIIILLFILVSIIITLITISFMETKDQITPIYSGPISMMYSCLNRDCQDNLVCDRSLNLCKLADGQKCIYSSDCSSNSICKDSKCSSK